MLASLLGYFFCTITMLTAVAVLLTSFANNSMRVDKGRLHLRPPVIERTAAAEETAQPHPASPQGASSVVAAAKADTKNSKQYKPKVFARRPNNYGYGYGYGLGYAEERGGPKGLFSADQPPKIKLEMRGADWGR